MKRIALLLAACCGAGGIPATATLVQIQMQIS